MSIFGVFAVITHINISSHIHSSYESVSLQNSNDQEKHTSFIRAVCFGALRNACQFDVEVDIKIQLVLFQVHYRVSVCVRARAHTIFLFLSLSFSLFLCVACMHEFYLYALHDLSHIATRENCHSIQFN